MVLSHNRKTFKFTFLNIYMDNLLLEIGLTNREKEIYLGLIKKGESSASEIAKDSTISRTHVYEALKSLIEKGLATSITRNFKKYYSAAKPSKILHYLDEKKEKIEEQKKRAKQVIQKLDFLKIKEKEPKIETYEGKEGVKTFLIETLKSKEPLLIINATKDFKETFTFFAEHYFKEKARRKIKSKVIFGEKFEFLDPFSEKRFLIKKEKSPTTTLTYEDNVAIILLLEKPILINIKSKEASKEYKNYFDILWNQSEKI